MQTRQDEGFTLVEVSIGMILLVVGTMAMAGSIALGARRVTGSQDQLLASQRASEAAETVFKARDNRVLTWDQIRNVQGATGADGGVFVDGPQPLREVGADGLANTADDGALTEIVKPGPDGLLGTADDVITPIVGFSREIEIRDLGPNLRQLRVIVRYRSPQGEAQFILTTYVSAYA
jgi:hypothetical protein